MLLWLLLLLNFLVDSSLVNCNFALLEASNTTEDECNNCAAVHFANQNFSAFRGLCNYSVTLAERLNSSCTLRSNETKLSCSCHTNRMIEICTVEDYYIDCNDRGSMIPLAAMGIFIATVIITCFLAYCKIKSSGVGPDLHLAENLQRAGMC